MKLLPKGRTPRDAALNYATFGWRVFPVYELLEEGACACVEGVKCGRPGKHPRVPEGVNEATVDPIVIEGWWAKWPRASIGVATGQVSGITVIDADAAKGKPGVINLTTLCAPHGGLPDTVVALTGGGGFHLYFKHCAALKTGTNTLAEAIDTRNDGGYVIAPPSGHASGVPYKWRRPDAKLLDVPEWLLQASANPVKARRGRPRKAPALRLEQVESMLASVEPDDRERWLHVGVILGRAFVGTGLENDAWTVYETWAARSAKFDEDRAGNTSRMREMFFERSQEAPRTGSTPLTVGTLVHWAKEGGWNPFGDRVAVNYEPGNEIKMIEELVAAAVGTDNRYFNVMGQVRDVIRSPLPSVRYLQAAHANGTKPKETLVVRTTSPTSMLAEMMRRAVLRTVDKEGLPMVVPIPLSLAALAVVSATEMFPPLSGVAEWPLVGYDGELIHRPTGYDPATGLYFDIDATLKLDLDMKPKDALKAVYEELFCDFPFETELHRAGALGLLLSFMQRPLMKTCPAYAVVAPQPGSGKSTLVEISALAIHGYPVPPHAFSLDDEELRKAVHALMIAKTPAILFDNVGRGMAVSSDQLSKLLTSEMSADRTLGASEMRKEMNTLLVTFTGNNISFVRDLASRVITLRLNPQTEDPLRRAFKHRDIRRWALERRGRWLSAAISLLRGANGLELEGGGSRFEDFDTMIVRPVLKATGLDIRALLTGDNEEDADADEEVRSMLTVLWRWQERWRNTLNGAEWRTADVMVAIENKLFDDSAVRVIQRGVGNARAWEQDATSALGRALRALNGSYRFTPMVLKATIDRKRTAQWRIAGGPALGVESGGGEAF